MVIDKSSLVINQVFSDMVYTSFEEIKEKNKKTIIDRIILDVNKYFTKKKMIVIQDRTLLSKVEDEYKAKVQKILNYTKKGKYSMSILIIAMLDYCCNVINDKELKNKFGHLSMNKILDECERKERLITMNTYKLINRVFN